MSKQPPWYICPVSYFKMKMISGCDCIRLQFLLCTLSSWCMWIQQKCEIWISPLVCNKVKESGGETLQLHCIKQCIRKYSAPWWQLLISSNLDAFIAEIFRLCYQKLMPGHNLAVRCVLAQLGHSSGVVLFLDIRVWSWTEQPWAVDLTGHLNPLSKHEQGKEIRSFVSEASNLWKANQWRQCCTLPTLWEVIFSFPSSVERFHRHWEEQ